MNYLLISYYLKQTSMHLKSIGTFVEIIHCDYYNQIKSKYKAVMLSSLPVSWQYLSFVDLNINFDFFKIQTSQFIFSTTSDSNWLKIKIKPSKFKKNIYDRPFKTHIFFTMKYFILQMKYRFSKIKRQIIIIIVFSLTWNNCYNIYAFY